MYLLRHGQSLFNLHFTETRKDPGIEDQVLTPLGHRQAEAAAELLAGKNITRLIVSPYTRALQTAEPVLARHNVPVDVMHEVRERYASGSRITSSIIYRTAGGRRHARARKKRSPGRVGFAPRWRRAQIRSPFCWSATGHSFWRSLASPSRMASYCNMTRVIRRQIMWSGGHEPAGFAGGR